MDALPTSSKLKLKKTTTNIMDALPATTKMDKNQSCHPKLFALIADISNCNKGEIKVVQTPSPNPKLQ